MSDFKAKMQQIRFRSPDPTGGAYSAPRPPSWIKGVLILRRGEGEGRREGKGRGGEW